MSTFGLLWQLKQAEVATLIDLLIAIGCLEQEDIDRFRPVLKLTPLGGDVMRGKAELPAGLKLPGDLRLKLRRSAARDAARPKVAPRVAEIGKVHEDLAIPYPASPKSPSLPKTPAALEQALDRTTDRGLPDEDSWRIGSTFEDAVEEGGPGDSFETARAAPERLAATVPKPAVVDPETLRGRQSEQSPAPVSRPSYYWTWRLLSQGFVADECLAIRGITREAMLDHLLQAAENGLKIRSDWCLSVEAIAALETIIGDSTPQQIRPLLTQLPSGTRYEEVQLYLKCRSS